MVTGRAAVADYPAGAHLPWRVIEDHELVWMLRGHARLLGEEAELGLAPGQLLLLPPGVAHAIEWDRTRPSRHGYLHFGPEHFDGAPPAEAQVRPMTSQDPLAGLCAYLLWLGRHEPQGWQERADETLRFLLARFVAGPLPGTDPQPALVEPLALAVAHLERAWSQVPLRRVGVAELASAASVSRGYFSRLFRAAFGLSPAPALEQARCARAETLLSRTDLPVESIARTCGFADLSHFSHRFTALHGLSPRAYRATGHPVLDHPGVRALSNLVWG
jgi:AraC family transcriptional regulator